MWIKDHFIKDCKMKSDKTIEQTLIKEIPYENIELKIIHALYIM